jgi:hypothetical protein
MTVQAATGSGGPSFASDEEGATPIHHPYTKLEFGANGTRTIVSETDPLPVKPLPVLTVGPSTLDAINEAVTLEVKGRPFVGIRVFSGASTANMRLMVEHSTDNEATWDERYFMNGDNWVAADILPHAVEDVRTYSVAVNPADTHVRLRVSAYTSGSISAGIQASTITDIAALKQVAFAYGPTTLDAAAEVMEIPVNYALSAGFYVTSSDLVGTLVVESSPYSHGDAVWTTCIFTYGAAWKVSLTDPAAAATITVPLTAGYQRLRVRCSARTSGSVVLMGRVSHAADAIASALSAALAGDPAPFFSTAMGGIDSGGLHRAVVAANGTPGGADYGLVVRAAYIPNVTLAAGTNTNEVVGDVADDIAAAGNPVRIGAQAKETDGTDPGSVSAEDDLAGLIADRNRRLLVNTAHPNLWSANENYATAQTNNALKAAPGANLSLYITDIIISNGATAGTIKIVEDTAGTPVDKIGPLYLAANGGMSKRFATPIRITANKDVGFTSVTVTTHTVTLSGYIAP